jgi:hypothetical protein
MKQTRWFSLGGYVSMRRERGLPDQKAEEKWKLGEKAYRDLVDEQQQEQTRRRRSSNEEDQQEGGKQDCGQWLGIEERKKWLKRFKTMDHIGKGLGDGGPSKPRAPKKSNKSTMGDAGGEEKPKKKASIAATRKKADPKGKGKQKALDQDDPGAEEVEGSPMNETGGERGESSASENVTPEPPKPRGRPRKHEPVEGKESWYQRKKRLDAERIAQGLEPEESYYARKKREEKEDREREAAGLPRLVREKPKRPRKSSEQPKIEEQIQGEGEGEDDKPVSAFLMVFT